MHLRSSSEGTKNTVATLLFVTINRSYEVKIIIIIIIVYHPFPMLRTA